jgi:hypothetical protein
MNDDSQLDLLLKKTAEEHHPQLPSPSLIWWRAQILRKQEEQARVERPVIIMRMVAMVACVVLIAALVIANRDMFSTLGANWLLLPLGGLVLAASLIAATMLKTSAKRR